MCSTGEEGLWPPGLGNTKEAVSLGFSPHVPWGRTSVHNPSIAI